MATLKTLRRSVSPFGFRTVGPGVFFELESKFEEAFGKPVESKKKPLNSFQDAANIPHYFNKLHSAAASDSIELEKLSRYLISHKVDFETKGLDQILFESMERLFDQKTEVFLIDHLTKETLEKMGLDGEGKDVILFAKERDILLGNYFMAITEKNPGAFSEFITRWTSSDNLDRILHFLDFSLYSKNPTFEHYLMFAHPALQRIVTNKNQMRGLLKKTEPLLKKMTSTSWEAELRKTLDI